MAEYGPTFATENCMRYTSRHPPLHTLYVRLCHQRVQFTAAFLAAQRNNRENQKSGVIEKEGQMRSLPDSDSTAEAFTHEYTEIFI